MEQQERDKTIDVAKGIAILLVVLGHSFPSNVYTGTSIWDSAAKLIYDFVYSFHMPVFFMVSGFLFANAWSQHRKGILKKKAFRLLVPYLTFSVIYIPLRIFASGLSNSEYGNQYWQIIFGISPNGGVWYLYTLFVLYVFTYYFVTNRNIKVVLSFSLILSIVSQVGFTAFYHLHEVQPRVLDICRFSLYFFIGLYYKANVIDKRRCKEVIMRYRIPKLILFILLFYIMEFCGYSIVTVPVALLGVNLTIIISSKLKECSFLSYFGRKSMELYLLHGPIMVGFRWLFLRIGLPKMCISVGLFISSIVITLLINTFFIHRYSVIEFLCTGVVKERSYEK